MDTIDLSVTLPRSVLAVAKVRDKELSDLMRESLALQLYRSGDRPDNRDKQRWHSALSVPRSSFLLSEFQCHCERPLGSEAIPSLVHGRRGLLRRGVYPERSEGLLLLRKGVSARGLLRPDQKRRDSQRQDKRCLCETRGFFASRSNLLLLEH
jgi:hypothetical protein